MSINLMRFCDKDNSNDNLQEPFNLEGMTIAANRHIIIVVPRNNKYKESQNDVINKAILDIFDKFESCDFKNLPDIKLPEPVGCWCCLGKGKATRKFCLECDGEGEVMASNAYSNYDVECMSCSGDGYAVNRKTDQICDVCYGAGTCYQRGFENIEVEGLYIDVFYLGMIVGLKDLKIAALNKKNMLLFQFSEGKGAIMKMDKELKKEP